MSQRVGSILVVDDDADVRDILSRRLGGRGHSVETASDGQEALDRIAENSFDVILLDIVMPGMSGLEVLKRLRKQHLAVDLPVIMVTSQDDVNSVAEALELGANSYVEKPVVLELDFDDLNERIVTLLALRSLE